ncbi:MAG TPA: fatty acid desaturase, partial [Mycobacterium sp.]|nr:fatty acid desaturase [Mycobacterium sp.]
MTGFGIVGAVVLGLVVAQVGLLVTTIYLHRSLSHRALRFAPGVVAVCRFLTWMLTGMRPREWVAVHRKHHAFTDTARDPHSPVVVGYARVQFANALLYRRVARDPATIARYARDLPPDRWDRVLFDHAALGLGLGIALLVVILGWKLALIAAAVHAVYYLLGGGAINAIGHTWGRR